ncbi:MAG: CvpA family protein [Bacteroidaceae bacterium]
MTTLDYILLAFLGAGALLGLYKGFIKQLATLLGLVVGLVIAKALYVPLAEKLCPTVTQSMDVAQIIAFALIWVAVPLAFTLVASLFTRAMEAISLGWLNRLLGFALGLLKYVLVVSLCINVLEFADTDGLLLSEETKQASRLYYPLKHFVGVVFPVVRQAALQYI